MGAQTDAARAGVVAARAEVETEIERLEASARAAVDIPAKIRREPVKTAGIAAGLAFLIAGGPQRLFRRTKRAVLGPNADRPKSMLPEEVDKELRKLGDDGERVRATLEREFAKYLEDREKERKKEGLTTAAAALALAALRPAAIRAGKTLAERALNPDGPSFEEQMERIRTRRRNQAEGGERADAPVDEGGGPQSGAGI